MEGLNSSFHSPALLAAQKRLLHLREQHRPTNQAVNLTETPRNGRPVSCHNSPGRTRKSPEECLSSLADQQPVPVEADRQSIKLYPDIGLAILRHEQAAPARVWLLLKHIDQRGRGWLPITKVRERLTGHSEGLRLCGWRQLRKLLARGEGLFWRRSPDRIWLRGVTKVARSLGVPRLTGHPIRLPVEACLKGIGPFRAHLYASFHSGRGNGQATNKTGGPISRASLSARSGVTAQSQRNYERRAGIRRLRNYAVGGHASPAEKQERAWLHGRASFEWIDHNGRLGRRSARYTAWQLPNSYHGPHSKRAKGQQKRINRKLADLFMKGMTGNDEPPIEQVIHHRKRFHNRGSSAASHYRRTSNQTIYWRSRAGRSGHYRLWHVLLPREKQLACG